MEVFLTSDIDGCSTDCHAEGSFGVKRVGKGRSYDFDTSVVSSESIMTESRNNVH